jgi:uncharacterized membrane protein required for colicin V production
MTILIDILLIVSIAAIGYFGYSAGFTRSFVASLAGFLSMFAAYIYPNQDGINFYLIFAITTVIIFMIGAFIFRTVHFFYMTILDKIGGTVLGVIVWTIVAVNIIIPSFDYNFRRTSPQTRIPIYIYLDESIRTHFPIFRHNASAILEKNVTQKIENISQKALELKNIVEEKK